MTRTAARTYVLSGHAAQRQAERRITTADILTALTRGTASPGHTHRTVYTGPDGTRVIVAPADRVIVTVTSGRRRRPAATAGPSGLRHTTSTPAAARKHVQAA